MGLTNGCYDVIDKENRVVANALTVKEAMHWTPYLSKQYDEALRKSKVEFTNGWYADGYTSRNPYFAHAKFEVYAPNGRPAAKVVTVESAEYLVRTLSNDKDVHILKIRFDNGWTLRWKPFGDGIA